MKSMTGLGVAFGAAILGSFFATDAMAVRKQTTTVNELAVYRYVWTDSAGRPRSVSIKRQGAGNPGNGGYAIQMTYQYVTVAGQVRTRKANSSSKNEGFGYFVAHERYRNFADGDNSPIAQKIFRTDDSPLGRGFPVTMTDIPMSGDRKGLEIALTYPKYGTKAPNGINGDGEDQPPLGTDPSLFRRYDLPVKIRWYFEDGVDYPRITTVVGLGPVPGPDRVNFDMRGPYGKIDFDEGDNPIRLVTWADRFQFRNTTQPLTRNSEWTWNAPNNAARFTALTAGKAEMGLVEPKRYGNSDTNDGYSEGRGQTSAEYSCPFQEKLPCDYEWPYQSAQYELPYDNPNGTTTSEKIAWGTTPFYGTSFNATSDGTDTTAFDGFPANKKLTYDVCVVLGEAIPGGLTRAVAKLGPTYNCASNR